MVVPTRSWVGTGPVLAGSHVVWGTDSPAAALYVSGPARRVWRAGRVHVPADLPRDPLYDARLVQRISAVASSSGKTAFVRAVDLQLIPSCASQDPPCLEPMRSEPFRGEVWSGRPTGPFRRIAGGKNLPIVLAADVDGSAILYSDTVPGESSRVVL